MSLFLASLQPFLHGVVIAAAAKKTTSGSSYFLPILLLAFLAIYFLWLRPQRNRLRSQQVQNREVTVGDEVVTNAGIVGRVISLEGDRVVIETGRNHTLTVLRSAIARRVDPVVPDYSAEEPPYGSGPSSGDPMDAAPDDDVPTGNDQWWPGQSGGTSESEGGPS